MINKNNNEIKLIYHYSTTGLSNVYILGPKEGGDAIIIDPGALDISLLNLIENNNFYIKHILLTHSHKSHTNGIKTMLKVYDAQVYAGEPQFLEVQASKIKNDQILNLENMNFRCIHTGGHSPDSFTFLCEQYLFSGDAFSAGKIGTTPNNISRNILINNIKTRIMTLPEPIMIFPGHGPPSLLNIENEFTYSEI